MQVYAQSIKQRKTQNNLLLVNRIDKTEYHNDGARSAVKVARSVRTGGKA